MASRSTITCFYDIVSPYSYFGVKLLNRYRQQPQWQNVAVEFRPVFLGGIMNGAKNQPPATIPAKGKYMIKDLHTISKITGIPFQFSSNFPLLTIPTMRLLIAIQKHESAKYEQCIEKLYDEYWVQDNDVTDAAILVKALSPILGSANAVEKYLQMTSDKGIKQTLMDNTQQAVDIGAFGAPTFIVKKAGTEAGEEVMFFGSDRFEMMASFLDLPYPGITFHKTSSPKL
ncbi:DSBA-like thioredoxin domain-containing protein [Lobosporangium transversale]|uniref:Glutathione S-transferase kappa n=1 Tax=Lobosporangium transversale TaxID=64571 RepID=A0A1Y2GDQ9_9FUNG|nr:DSBA-like thioredoxin domain-containing protein [Lobosporangium transversale]ORZ07992.1 DSBA-like thioredoxin domain-containing protein [Lobosporangium transversale]|eukprot:XP_021878226.1 DSBA-like thioredoxin domain-containing protein [Lobosporangium transversale]